MTDYRVELPTLHPGQVSAYNLPARFKAGRCGRRWGKTKFGTTIAMDDAINSRSVGWFAPEYKFLSEPYQEIQATLSGLVSSSSESKGVIRTRSRGNIDFWSLENPLAGRGRKYHRVIIDECAFAKPNMFDVWRKNIRPTLVDYRGRALALSNTNGIDPQNFMWKICNEPKHGFVQFHAPSSDNPLLDRQELADLKRDSHPLVWRQEYEAEFVDWSGVSFFTRDKLLVNDLPVPYPPHCDSVFAVVDSATKTGRENDGTGVVYCAYMRNPTFGYRLVILDWELVQVEGDLLIQWVPHIFEHLKELAVQCRARNGSIGTWIEDKSSGIVLIQHAANNQWPARAIDSGLTALGKVERAISISKYVFPGMVKISGVAFDKVSVYKEVVLNHLLSQVVGFKIGSKDQVDDDLLDCFCYAVALALGNSEGF